MYGDQKLKFVQNALASKDSLVGKIKESMVYNRFFEARHGAPILQYVNGNAVVDLYKNGLRTRQYLKNGQDYGFDPFFVDSIDLKITDYCDAKCAYCHEASTTKGKHGYLPDIVEMVNMAAIRANPIEIAIGGGNPLSHPELVTFLKSLKKSGAAVPSLTVNLHHILRTNQYIADLQHLLDEKLIYGLGISIPNKPTNLVSMNEQHCLSKGVADIISNPSVCFHVINRVNREGLDDVDNLLNRLNLDLKSKNFLVLGYKDYGRGSNAANKKKYNKNDDKMINSVLDRIKEPGIRIAFDNLAIEQLYLFAVLVNRGTLTESEWRTLYQGEEGTASMYLDAVKQEFASTSYSTERFPFGSVAYDMVEMFNKTKKPRFLERSWKSKS